MGNGNSVQSKQGKDRRRALESTDGSSASRPRRPGNGNVSGGAGGPGETTKTLKKIPRATNPFIIFFLRLRSKKPKEHVVTIARVAGKLWARMSLEERKKYIDLANAEKKRREEKKRKQKITRN